MIAPIPPEVVGQRIIEWLENEARADERMHDEAARRMKVVLESGGTVVRREEYRDPISGTFERRVIDAQTGAVLSHTDVSFEESWKARWYDYHEMMGSAAEAIPDIDPPFDFLHDVNVDAADALRELGR